MQPIEDSLPGTRNHPLAKRMAAIAFIGQNITIGCIFGSFSVLLGAAGSRLDAGTNLTSWGIPAVTLSTALCAPAVGALAARYSLRILLIIGALLGVAGFALLALTASYPLYVIAYGLLLGPGMAVGVILPGALVTRWFRAGRGKALGFVATPLAIAVVPLLSNWVLQHHGLTAAYWMLAGLSLFSTISMIFVIDWPPGAAAAAAAATQAAPSPDAGGLSMGQLLSAPRFWGVTFAFIASAVSSVVLSVHVVPMAESWGLSATVGATLFSIQGLIGIAGTNLFGWVADRLGAVLAMVLVAFDAAILWLLLLMHPSFPVAAVIIGLIGLHGAGVVPAFSAALSEVFGRENFSRAYGLAQLVILPFSVFCVPAAAFIDNRTGSYDDVLIAVAVFLGVTSLLAFLARRRRVVKLAA